MRCTPKGGGSANTVVNTYNIDNWKKETNIPAGKKVIFPFEDRTQPSRSCTHSACCLVWHDTVGRPSHCYLSVWYFYPQLLFGRSCYVGRGSNGPGVLCLDSLCSAVKGKICHTLWTQFAVLPKVKFYELRRLCYAVSGKRQHTGLGFLCSQRKKVLSWAVSLGFFHAVLTVCRHRQRFKTLRSLLSWQNYDYCWDQCICQWS